MTKKESWGQGSDEECSSNLNSSKGGSGVAPEGEVYRQKGGFS